MLSSVRDKLSRKDRALFKLAVWTCLIVWMVFFFIHAIILSNVARNMAYTWYGDTWGGLMRWVLPTLIVFLSLFINFLTARWARKKLS